MYLNLKMGAFESPDFGLRRETHRGWGVLDQSFCPTVSHRAAID